MRGIDATLSAILFASATVPALLVGGAIALFFDARAALPELGELAAGTIEVALVALLVAVPLGLASAAYLAELASPLERRLFRPLFAALAGVPGVAFGWAAVMVLEPELRAALPGAATARLAAGIMLGAMLTPVVSSLAQDALHAVPRALREAGWALGASELAVLGRVVLPAAKGGLLAAVLLATSRALGETMVVWIAAGPGASLSARMASGRVAGELEPVLALGGALLAITLPLNALAHRWVKKTRSWI